jgi:TolB-like protein
MPPGNEKVTDHRARRSAARIRINVQLIDAEDGTHLWAERVLRYMFILLE